jgi:hypothetical protein
LKAGKTLEIGTHRTTEAPPRKYVGRLLGILESPNEPRVVVLKTGPRLYDVVELWAIAYVNEVVLA